MLVLYALLILMIIGALAALEVRDLLSSVVAVGAVGLVLSLVFLLLQAPDAALTQLTVEIITVVMLIRATIARDLCRDMGAGGILNLVIAAGFVVGLIVAGIWALPELPQFGEPLLRVAGRYLDQGLGETGAANLVTAVLLDYRAWDTLGEATVLFTAVIGVLTLTRRVGRKALGTTIEEDLGSAK